MPTGWDGNETAARIRAALQIGQLIDRARMIEQLHARAIQVRQQLREQLRRRAVAGAVTDAVTRERFDRPIMMLLDLVLELLSDAGITPSSDRGLVAMNAAGSLGCGLASIFLNGARVHLLSDSGWPVYILLVSFIMGLVGTMLSILHIVRNPLERGFGIVCLLASVAGPLIPLAL